MYSKGVNVDARYEGRVILSPKELAAMALPTTPALLNGDLEDWDGDPDNFTQTGDALGVSGAGRTENCGYIWEVDGVQKAGTIYQNIAWDDAYRSTTFQASAWAKVPDEGHETTGYVRVGIYDGVTTTYGDKTIAAGWVNVTHTKVLASNATEVRVVVDYAIKKLVMAASLYIDDISLTGYIGGATEKQLVFGDTIVVANSNNLLKVSSGALSYVYTFPAAITDLCVFSSTTGDKTNRLYIALGWDNAYWYTSDLATFTQCTLTKNTAKHMSNVGGGNQFWISDSNSTMTDSDKPYNGGTEFSTPSYQIRSDDYDITGLIDNEEGTVYVRKQNNLYYLSGADVLELIPELEAESNTTYEYPLYIWQGKLYIAAGVNALYEYDDGVVTILSPSYFVNTITLSGGFGAGASDFDEEVLAICADAHYLYVTIDNGTTVEVLSGSWKTVQGAYDWYWHTLYELTNNDWTSMLISSADSSVKRMYVGTDTYTDGIKKFIVPITYSDVLVESGYEVEAAGTFYTPWFRSNFPTENKYWETVSVTAICVTDKTSIGVHYQKKGDTTWTDLGDCTPQALVSGDYPPENTSKFNIRVESERIRFKFELAAADDDYSPILFGLGGGIGITAILTAGKIRLLDFTLYIATKIRERNLAVKSRTISTDLSALRVMYLKTDTPITVTAPDGTGYTCFFYREGYEEQLVYDHVGRNEAWEVRMRLVERYDVS